MPKTQGYESHADMYDQWFEENAELYAAEIAAIKKLLPAGKGVEIGAGSGRFTKPLNIHTGIEPAKAMREKSLAQGLNIIEGTAENLPLKDHEFDFAIFVTSTCFLDNPVKAYQEAHRVTHATGKILVAYLERESELGQIYQIHKNESTFYCDATFYTYAEITDFLTQAGFGHFKSVQTVLPETHSQQPNNILDGHDQGLFVVIYAEKI
ncbi:class I SAM-dependent methyltransferase [Thiomicrorhabdus indica]|uniref:class I SAM-dependent methyltransferase n=1 Tax=Thiomicrorhabdus indica TaxID=2267253 RepID=UPI002AA92726|nr:class I SAM-dependent methyltransferase [Thiomicrorhabdus indica]